MKRIAVLLLLASCSMSEVIQEPRMMEPITKADTTQTDNDTTNIDIIVDTTLIPISFDVTIEDWEEVEP